MKLGRVVYSAGKRLTDRQELKKKREVYRTFRVLTIDMKAQVVEV